MLFQGSDDVQQRELHEVDSTHKIQFNFGLNCLLEPLRFQIDRLNRISFLRQSKRNLMASYCVYPKWLENFQITSLFIQKDVPVTGLNCFYDKNHLRKDHFSTGNFNEARQIQLKHESACELIWITFSFYETRSAFPSGWKKQPLTSQCSVECTFLSNK